MTNPLQPLSSPAQTPFVSPSRLQGSVSPRQSVWLPIPLYLEGPGLQFTKQDGFVQSISPSRHSACKSSRSQQALSFCPAASFRDDEPGAGQGVLAVSSDLGRGCSCGESGSAKRGWMSPEASLPSPPSSSILTLPTWFILAPPTPYLQTICPCVPACPDCLSKASAASPDNPKTRGPGELGGAQGKWSSGMLWCVPSLLQNLQCLPVDMDRSDA